MIRLLVYFITHAPSDYVKHLQQLKREWEIHLAENSDLSETYWYKQKELALAWVDMKISIFSLII